MSNRANEFCNLIVKNIANFIGKTFISQLIVPSRNFRVELFAPYLKNKNTN